MTLRPLIQYIQKTIMSAIASSSSSAVDASGSLKRKEPPAAAGEEVVLGEEVAVPVVSREQRRQDKKRRKEEVKALVSTPSMAESGLGLRRGAQREGGARAELNRLGLESS